MKLSHCVHHYCMAMKHDALATAYQMRFYRAVKDVTRLIWNCIEEVRWHHFDNRGLSECKNHVLSMDISKITKINCVLENKKDGLGKW